ncbi:MAG: iron ABC transporter permease [Alphaproteobacteria bacterium]|nr:iron ABC transporter permease [Alphaproteobacteria bacterium]
MSATAKDKQTTGARPPARRRWRPGAIGLIALAVALTLSLPVLTVAAHLFQSTDLMGHLAGTLLPRYIGNTLWMMVGVPIGVGVIGTACAWLVTMCRFPGRLIFEWALILPLAAPAYILAYVYSDFLQHSGPVQTGLRDLMGWGPREGWFPNVRSLPGAILMFTLTLYPYVYLLARAAFLEQSVGVFEAARTLGCSAWAAFRRIALPLARPAIATGVALALMETLADFGTVAHFGVQTFTTGVYRALYSFGDPVAAAQLASMLLGFVFLLLALERATRGRRGFQSTGTYKILPGYRLTGWRAAAAFAACLAPIALGFLLPAGLMIAMALEAGNLFEARTLELVWNSFSLAAIAAVAAVLTALVLAYANRLDRSKLARGAVRVSGLGYAVPGSVIAVGLLIPLGGFDNWLDGHMRDLFGISTGLIFTGGIAALIYAYLVRFMAVALQTVEAGLTKVTPSMDDASRTLGRGPWRTVKEVHAPILSTSLLTAGLIVFVDVMKELPATLILRPFDFNTLAITAYNLASDERLMLSAAPSLMIVLVGLLPIIVISRRIAAARPGAAAKRTRRGLRFLPFAR